MTLFPGWVPLTGVVTRHSLQTPRKHHAMTHNNRQAALLFHISPTSCSALHLQTARPTNHILLSDTLTPQQPMRAVQRMFFSVRGGVVGMIDSFARLSLWEFEGLCFYHDQVWDPDGERDTLKRLNHVLKSPSVLEIQPGNGPFSNTIF